MGVTGPAGSGLDSNLQTLDSLVTCNNVLLSGPSSATSWQTSAGASYTNGTGASYPLNLQTVTLTSTAYLVTYITNPKPGVSSACSLLVQLGTCTAFTIVMLAAPNTVIASLTTSASNTGWTQVTIPFTSPASSATTIGILIGNFGTSAMVGTANIAQVTVYTGSSLSTSQLGSLSVSNTVAAADFLYGATGSSLVSKLSALSLQVGPTGAAGSTGSSGAAGVTGPPGSGTTSNPNFTGTLTTTGDVIYGASALSLTTELGKKAPSISPSLANPTFTGTATASGLNVNQGLSVSGTLSGGAITGSTLAISGNTTFNGNVTTNFNCTHAGATSCTAGLTTNSLTVTGDVLYGSGSSSLTNSIAALQAYKTSGTLAATTAFQTFFLINSSGPPVRGMVTVTGTSASYQGMCMALFEWTSGGTIASLTQLASSGSSAQVGLQTTGTIVAFNAVSVQISGYSLQAKATGSTTLNWYITYL